MKKMLKKLTAVTVFGGIIAGSASVFAQAGAFVPNDLYMGFQNSIGGGTADYIINLGPASGIVGGNSVVSLTADFSISRFNSAGLVGTNSSGIYGGVVGGSNGNSPSDLYLTQFRSGGAGVPSVPGSTAPAGLTRSQDNEAYADIAQISPPVAGTNALDASKSWESYVEPTFTANSLYGTITVNPDSSVVTNSVVYEDLWYTTNSSGLGGTKPFIYQGYFTLTLTGSSPSLTFTPAAAPAPLTSPKIVSVSFSGHMATLIWTTVPTHSYQLQYTASLSPTNWINVGSSTLAANSLMTNSDPAATAAYKFYRVTGQ